MVAASAESWNEMRIFHRHYCPRDVTQVCLVQGGVRHTGRSHGFSYRGEWENTSTSVKELVPIIMAAAIWRPQWMGLSVLALCGSGAANQRKVGKGPGLDAPPTLFVLF